MKLNLMTAGLLSGAALLTAGMFGTSTASAVELHFVMGQTGNDLAVFQTLFKDFEKQTGDTVTVVPMPSSTTDQFGQYRLWLSAGNADIDVYMTDVIWAPQLASNLVDLTDAAKAAGIHRRAGTLLSQGSPRQVQAACPHHLGPARDRSQDDPGR